MTNLFCRKYKEIYISEPETPGLNEAKWVFQVILDTGNRVRAETFADHTCLTIDVTEREDSGNYKIVLQNEAGEDTACVKVKVVGKTLSPGRT